MKIRKGDVAEILPLTPMQEGLLFHYLKTPEGDQYRIRSCLEIFGRIDIAVFKQAWQRVTDLNGMLRTVFRWEGVKQPVQMVLKRHIPEVRFDEDDGDRQEILDLRRVVFRVRLSQLAPDHYRMVVSHHHILMDGWSLGIVLEEFFEAYSDLARNRLSPLPVKSGFKLFIRWLQSRDARRQENFWRSYLHGLDIRSRFPDMTFKAVSHRGSGCEEIVFSGDLRCRLEDYTRECQATLPVLLYSAWGILLQKYLNQPDVVFGTTVSGRQASVAGIEKMVGLLINTLPLRLNVGGDEKLSDVLILIKEGLEQRRDYEDTPLSAINTWSGLREGGELFDTLMVVENYPLADLASGRSGGPLSVGTISVVEATHYPLTLGITARDDIRLQFSYRCSRFTRQAVHRLAGHFHRLLEKFLSDPHRSLAAVDMLSAEEKQQILDDFNDTWRDYPGHKRIHQFFEEGAARYPHRIALEGIGLPSVMTGLFRQLSYGELNDRSNRLSLRLQRLVGIEGGIAALGCERSIDMIIGILAILKARCAYLPIDPGYPAERVRFMLADSAARLWLTAEDGTLEVKRTDGHRYLPPEKSGRRTADLAYIIYTSGSTGRPKGVMVAHGSVVNRLAWMQRKYPLGERDAILQKTAVTFDVSVWELFWWAMSGARLSQLVPGGEKDPAAVTAAVARFGITVLHFVPSMLAAMLEYVEEGGNFVQLKSLRRVFASGEKLTVVQVRAFNRLLYRNNSTTLINLYGPTEATVDVSFFDCSPGPVGEVIPIGKPIDNLRLLVRDLYGQLAPVGVAGELYITGAGVARGYLNRPELTARRFPSSSLDLFDEFPTPTQYRTGDLARWLPDGNIDFLGRTDDQVKIRGHRVELGEIESRLQVHDRVGEAVVILMKDIQAHSYLTAYIVPVPAGIVSIPEAELAARLAEYAAHHLPHYMIPSYFILLERLPRLPSGKIDRRALPRPEIQRFSDDFIPPGDETEIRLASIWADVLGRARERIGVQTDFFRSGGHSLKAMRLALMIHREFNVEMPVALIFKFSTIRGQADYIKRAREVPFTDIPPVPGTESGLYPLSSAQKRLFFLDRFEDIGTSYNMPGVVRIKGTIDIERLEKSLHRLIARHEALRTSFEYDGNIPGQRVHSQVDFKVDYVAPGEFGDWNPEYTEDGDLYLAKTSAFVRPFDISKAPLLRVGCLSLDNGRDHWLLFDMHHIISDGTSLGIIIRDFRQFYEGRRLRPLKIQYKDFASWQNRLFATGGVRGQEGYWLDRFDGEIPRLNLPGDFPRPPVFSFAGDQYGLDVKDRDRRRLRLGGEEAGTTLFMNLLAAFNVLLYKYTGQEDIVVGTSVAGRRHADLQKVLGMFVNALALRNQPRGDKPFREFLQEVKRTSLEAFENQDLQFEELVDRLDPPRDPSRNPLFDVCLVLQNFEREKIELAGAAVEYRPLYQRTSKFDLTLFVYEQGRTISFVFEYYSAFFKRSTVERLAAHLVRIIRQVTETPALQLAAIDMLAPAEKRMLVRDFNRTAVKYPQGLTLHHWFESRVEISPDAVALEERQCNRFLSYRELDGRADRAAGYLRQVEGVGPDTPVGILLDRSEYFIIGIWAILKSGGAFVPMDPDVPEDRLKGIIDDAAVGSVLSGKRFIKVLNRLQWSCSQFDAFLCLDSEDVHSEEEVEKSGLMDEKLWDYVAASAADDITGGGWVSSFTGLPFSRKEMDEYGDNILKKLIPLLQADMRVLEIGCASGISMYRLAPLVWMYCGIDLSGAMIEKNRRLAESGGFSNIILACLPAHRIDELAEKGFDLVILNSVVQSFHGHNYLRKVIRKIITSMGRSGYIFIGDVMDQQKKAAMEAELADFKARHSGDALNTKTDWSTELFLQRGFFEDLKTEMPEIRRLDFSDKIFTVENELTKFRYDVLLKIEKGRRRQSGSGRRDNKLKRQYDSRVLAGQTGLRPSAALKSSCLAYIMYTSGTTGRPKGVMIQHRSLVNYLHWGITTYHGGGRCHFPLYTSVTFDLTLTSIFLPLLSGGTVKIYGSGGGDDYFPLAKVLADNDVEAIKATPSHLKMLLRSEQGIPDGSRVRRWIVGGEALETELARLLYEGFSRNIIIYNEYGPTEATVGCMIHLYDPGRQRGGTVPIGRPAANVGIHLLDEGGYPVPFNALGEIFIGGEGLARGYLNQPELTAHKFVKIDAPVLPPGSRVLYRSGDLACRPGEEDIEFRGRRDDQVKVRGFRIETQDIRRHLLTCAGVKEAAVVARTDRQGDGYLSAYVTVEGELPVNKIREHLACRLPAYMIPDYVVKMPRLPLDRSGKLAVARLPDPPDFSTVGGTAGITPPGDEIEEKLAQIWTDVLGMESRQIGIDTDFFDLGGHSLRATVVLARIHRELNVRLPLAEMFKSPSVRRLARLIRRSRRDDYSLMVSHERREYYPLSSAQKRLFFLDRLEETGVSYNMPAVFRVEGDLDRDRLNEATGILIQRHETLRTSFVMIGDEPVQRVHPQLEFGIEYDVVDESAAQDSRSVEEDTRLPSAVMNFFRSFDLSAPPLLRLGLVETGPSAGLFLFDMHHIIADGTSIEVLTGEFIRLYAGEKLVPLRLQYRDFALWQIDLQNSGKIGDQEQYWLRLYSDGRDIPRLNLPSDFQRPTLFSFEGDILDFELDPQSTAGLKKLARHANVTLAITLNAALNVLLYKYTGQDDLVVGCGIMGRRHVDLMPLIGMFVNVLALRHHLCPEMSFSEFLDEVATHSVMAMENQDVQFESLVDLLHLDRDPSRNPLFDVSLVVQNFERSARTLSDLDLKFDPYPFRNKTCKFDLTLFAAERDDRFEFRLEYYTALFRSETMVRLCRHFLHLIRQTMDTPGVLLREIDMLSPVERHQLLIDFNRTSAPYPSDRTIHQVFEEQARNDPHQVAVVSMAEEADGGAPEARHLTFRGLDGAADRLAAYIRAQGHGRSGEAVALLMEGGAELATAILGVLKAGALYVPLAPSLPEARLKKILNDTAIEIVISLGRHVRLLNRLQWQCSSFRTFLCLDSRDVHAETERGGDGLMDRKLWDYVAETGRDDITAGGWLSSYTGLPFSREEMDEYGENILRKLAPLLHRQMRVLEIGCASGITMYRIAPRVGSYYGTDLSAVTIEKNERRVQIEGIENIVLRRLAAHEIDEIGGAPFDLVIINSVVQAFPGHNYLRQVIGKSVGLLADNGFLFIGDIMDQEMKEALYRDLLDFKRKSRDHTIQTKLDLSAELFVSRQFFRDLQVDMPQIRELQFSAKIHTIDNELTRFRYDVLIRIDNVRRGKAINRAKCKYQHDAGDLEQYGQFPVPGRIGPHQPAYMIFTSGTSGMPRGILVEHRSLVNFIFWRIHHFRFSAADVTLQLFSPSFDGFAANFYPPLLTGGRLVLLETADKMDLNHIGAVFQKETITNSTLVPDMFQALLTGLPPGTMADLRFIVLAGDKAVSELLALSRKMYPSLSLHNEYGPTEATVAATAFSGMTEDTCSIIGEPIANQRVFILDRHRKLQPIGIPGELYIAGRGLSRGYLNQPELTAAQFIRFPLEPASAEISAGLAMHSPASPIRDMKPRNFYRTGDLCRWRPDGTIEFMGRIDHQVKIRGYRIELAEIENCLLRHDGILEAVAAARQYEDGEKSLVAYIVYSGGMSDSDLQLREYLSRFIPHYMIPLQFIEMKRLPRTTTGKLDRRALPLTDSTRKDGGYEAPAGDVEHSLTGIWSAVLGISAASIGVKDDFFSLGGHSLKATSLAARIHRELNVKVPLSEIFKNPTIRGLARYIGGRAVEKYAAVRPVEKREYYRTSPAQQRFYLLQQMRRESIAFNMPGLIILESREAEVEWGKIEASLDLLLHRHHSLRTSFHLLGESLVQKSDDALDFKLEYYDSTARVPKEVKDGEDLRPLQEIVDGFIRPFDLGRAPLLRAGLIRLHPCRELTHPGPSGHPSQEGTYVLMFDMHHIVSDGTSMNILSRDFNLLCSGGELPALSLQYRDFCHWQYELLESGQLKDTESFWLERLNGEIPLLSLATDFPRPEVMSQTGDMVSFRLGKSLCSGLQVLRQQTGTTLYMVLLAALNVLLFRYTGQTDILIGSPVAGRHHADLQSVIGLLLGSVIVRSFPEGFKAFEAFLLEVKESSLRAFENQAYPLEELLKKIDYRESPGRNPLSDVALMVQNMEEENHFRSALQEYPVRLPRTSRMDLTLSAREGDCGIELLWEYRSDLFRRQTVERLAGHFIQLLKEVVRVPEISLADINLVSEDERGQLLGSPARLYPLSHAQKRIYYTQRRYPDTTVAVLGCLVCFPQALDMELMAEAIDRVILRHEALRLRLVEFDFEQEPCQYVAPYERRPIDLVDLDVQSRDLLAFCSEMMARPFSRQRGDLFHAVRLKLGGGRTGYFLKAHHLVADGWTLSMLAEQIHRIYEDLKAQKPMSQSGSPSYLEYLDAERDYFRSPQARQDRDFWLCSLLPLPTEVRLSYRQADDSDIRAGDTKFLIPAEAVDSLRRFCREPNITTTVYQVLLTVLSIYIYRVCGVNDFVIGSAHHNRSSGSQRRMAGMFVSTVPLRIELDGHQDFLSLLQLSGETIRCALKHHFRYPFDLLAPQLAEKSGRNCDYLLNVNLIGQKKIGDRGFSRDAHFSPYEESHLTIHIFDEPALDRLEWQWLYRLALFSPADIDRIQRGLINTLRDALSNPGKKISDLEILSAEEKYRLIEGLCGPAVDYPGDRTLQQIFSDSVEMNPHHIALMAPCSHASGSGESRQFNISYRELENQAIQLARCLVEEGAGLDVIVGLIARPSLEMIVAVLGILHAGAAYLPLDPDYPQERIRYILADSGARIVLNTDAAEPPVEGYTGQISRIPVFLEGTDSRRSPVKGQANSGGLAYLIYTSGSTGQPKGVPVNHGNVTAYLRSFECEFSLGTEDTVIQQASFSFDAFVEEMYPILSKGGRLAVASRAVVREIERLVRFIRKHRITVMSCSPLLLSELNRLKPELGIRLYISGGDVLRPEYIDYLVGTGKVYNTYGPTETTVCATYYRCPAGLAADVPIGSPIAYYRLCILDRNGKWLPTGVAGELCIAGPGVTRGYLNNPELTAGKFVTVPSGSPHNRGGPKGRGVSDTQILYRTGDLGRLLADGQIGFLGRIDQQVKIRGYRIELGEIENRLRQHGKIQDAAVVDLHDEDGEKFLAAYLVSRSAGPLSPEVLREYLDRFLAGYMVPRYFINIKHLPLTPGGKLDREQLPLPAVTSVAAPPRDELEAGLADLFGEVLHLDRQEIGIDADFFHLGGHSLKAARLASRIMKNFRVKLHLAEIFKIPTIRQLAARIRTAAGDRFFSIAAAEKREYYPLSSVQRRLYSLYRVNPGNVSYNMPLIFQVEGRFDLERLEAAFSGLIRRHESLRTSFRLVGDEPVQKVDGEAAFKIEFGDSVPHPPTCSINSVIQTFIRPFELSRPPLIRVGLGGEDIETYLMVDMHHIVSDGISHAVLTRDFVALYRGSDLPDLKIHYKDYCLWQNPREADPSPAGKLPVQEVYWLERFKGELPLLELPVDFLRPPLQGFEGDSLHFRLGNKPTRALLEMSGREGVTPFMILLAIYTIMLSKLSGQEDVVVGTSVAGRRHADLEGVIGMFVNALALRNFPAADKRFMDFLEEIKESTIAAFDNQDYPFEHLVDRIVSKRIPGRNPVFDVMFVLNNEDTPITEIPGLKLRYYDYERRAAQMDLKLRAMETAGDFHFTFEYDTQLFRRQTVEMLARNFTEVGTAVLENNHLYLKDIWISHGLLSTQKDTSSMEFGF